jgi:demethylmenaquinone methyltransferase/2-methoxy-6-polyprenyl-1,4-benzoquinol methylase
MSVYYCRRAAWHDEYMEYHGNRAMEKLLGPIISYLEPLVVDKNLLEVACGTGNWTDVWSRRARQVTATDYSREALDIAREKLAENERVTLLEADAYRLEELPGKYELAFAADWYSHIPRGTIPEFLDGLHKTLQTGAAVIFLDMSLHRGLEQWETYFDREGNRINRRGVPDGSVYEVVKNFPSEEELRAVLDPHGTEIEYREFQSLKRWVVTYRVR